MSAPKPNQPESLLGLTMSEARMILLGVLSSDESGKVDFDKLAVKGNYKNAQSASTLYRKAKRRLLEVHNNPAEGSGTSISPAKEPASTTATPKKTPAKRGKDKAVADDENPGVSENTPTKGKRQKTAGTPKTPRSATKAVKAEALNNEGATTPTPVQGKPIVKEEQDMELGNSTVKEESKSSDDEELMSTSQMSAEFSVMDQHPNTPK
ncbi:hypothetical protein AbraIFM66951_003057 [Aspergillus brasiliensis]|uniref:Histone h1.3 n=1 Tax=Aspergillus brasiliensis TaxID=319629 RepID=A0A9W5YR55_9EURO|nr:hypothetical protein AbraCBS73388_006373 [Aspergillus brasiliensis]GKZ42909.1 hypothetical protein AbraIFM66951_003057 [Aspergillus brasiliensis]